VLHFRVHGWSVPLVGVIKLLEVLLEGGGRANQHKETAGQ